MRDTYAWEKYYLAVRTLAIGTDTLRNRIENAWIHNMLHVGQSNFQSPALWERHEALQGKLKQEFSAASPESGQMSDDALRDLAGEFVSIFNAVCKGEE